MAPTLRSRDPSGPAESSLTTPRSETSESVGHAAELLGEVLDGRYQIVGQLGEGGMGRVYEAIQLKLDRPVAIKVLHVDLSRDADFRARFEREARALARINHDNVLHAYDHGVTRGGCLYLVTELLYGQPLDLLIGAAPDRRLPLGQSVSILRQIASALAAVHGFLVHRDIKPHNVMVTSTKAGMKAKLLDFGLVKPTHGSQLTSSAIMGTPAYMSPEQIAQDPDLDARSDLYSFGAMAFEVLTGRKPFDSDKIIDVLTSHIGKPAPRIDAVLPDVAFPSELVELVDLLLRKAPDARPQSASDVKDRLLTIETRLSAGWMPTAMPVVATPSLSHSSSIEASVVRAPTTARRVSKAALLAIGSILLVVATASVAVTSSSSPSPRPVVPPEPPPLAEVAPGATGAPRGAFVAPSDDRRRTRPIETADVAGDARPQGRASGGATEKKAVRSAGAPRRETEHPRRAERESSGSRAAAAAPARQARRSSPKPRLPAAAKVGFVEVTGFTITGRRPSIEVSSRGVVVGRGRRVRLRLSPGTHRLVVRRIGDAKNRIRTVTVEGGKTTEAKVLLD